MCKNIMKKKFKKYEIFTVHNKVHTGTYFMDSTLMKQEVELGLACSFNHLKENIIEINSDS